MHFKKVVTNMWGKDKKIIYYQSQKTNHLFS